jgi:hypothetical protein
MFLNIIKSERLLKSSTGDDIAVVDEVTCDTRETSTQTPVENKPTVCEPADIPEKNKACDPNAVEEDESDESVRHLLSKRTVQLLGVGLRSVGKWSP